MLSMDRLDEIARRFDYLEARLAEGGGDVAETAREYARLKPVAEAVAEFRALVRETAETEALRADPDMRALAEEELARLAARRDAIEQALRVALLPRDAADDRPAILEIRAGTGGEEAALFAADLLRMYQRHAEGHGWRFELVEASESDLGGTREAVARIAGDGVFARLKYESGVHRVQRVPQTESGGRIHTSAATVAVLPEAEEVDVQIDPAELEITVARASGPGGQGVNTTDSAVQILHKPTGMIVKCADERSQLKNKAKALKVLRSRLLEQKEREERAKYAANRKSQVGSGDRSERIRTYNFPQGRLTDHRIGLTLYKLGEVMQGDLDEIIDALTETDQAQQLAEMDA